jgi:hypothetical protein
MGQNDNLQGQIDQHGKPLFRWKILALAQDVQRTRPEPGKPESALNDRTLFTITPFRPRSFMGGRLEVSSDGIKLELHHPITL